MAKVNFNKLGLVKDTSIDSFEWNGQTIEVKQYLPIEDKTNLIADILNNSIDNNGYYNPIRLYIVTIVEVVKAYTNINITEKQSEDMFKLYDLLVSSGFSAKVIGEYINPAEYGQIRAWCDEVIHNIYEYRNSAVGIAENVVAEFKEMDLNADDVINKIKEGTDLGLLKEVINKLG